MNIFLSEGAGVESIIADMNKNGEEVIRDAFGHVRLDEIKPGQWFAKKFSKKLEAEKILVQKSGYFARSSAPNQKDLDLIFKTIDLACEVALDGQNGVVGLNENDKLNCIDFKEIKGGKPFNYEQKWFQKMLQEIDQIN